MKDTIICFGEVLFDLFPSGKKPGGAPMNVAIHLRNLEMNSAMVTAVGDDVHGKELISFLEERKVKSHLIQEAEYPTGTVEVQLDARGIPSYRIVEHVAWDHIDDAFLSEEIEDTAFIVHGSLACRSETSRESLLKLLNASRAKVVFDLNLREPYYDQQLIEKLIRSADILKLNELELGILAEWNGWKSTSDKDRLLELLANYPQLELVLVTQGGEGAMVWQNGNIVHAKSLKVEVVDTVGCGDAFLGAFLAEYHRNDDVKAALSFAMATGAFVATHHGANPKYSREDILHFISEVDG